MGIREHLRAQATRHRGDEEASTTTASSHLIGYVDINDNKWDIAAGYTITHTGTTPITNWRAPFDLPANEPITNVWNANLAHDGTQYGAPPKSYDSTIEPGSR